MTRPFRAAVPAGPRKSGEGVEDEEQGIVSAEATPAGCVTACHNCLPVCHSWCEA